MNQQDYMETWERLLSESVDLQDQRDAMETKLSEITSQIAYLEEILKNLRPLAGLPRQEDIAGLGITDAIRLVMESSGERMSASDVRRELTNRGFDLTKYSAPMSSIYKILSRLADDPDSCVVRFRDENGVFYSWKKSVGPNRLTAGGDDYPHSTEITDDDIPF